MTDSDVGTELPLGSGGDVYAVGRDAANGERCKQAAQRRTCHEKRRHVIQVSRYCGSKSGLWIFRHQNHANKFYGYSTSTEERVVKVL